MARRRRTGRREAARQQEEKVRVAPAVGGSKYRPIRIGLRRQEQRHHQLLPGRAQRPKRPQQVVPFRQLPAHRQVPPLRARARLLRQLSRMVNAVRARLLISHERGLPTQINTTTSDSICAAMARSAAYPLPTHSIQTTQMMMIFQNCGHRIILISGIANSNFPCPSCAGARPRRPPMRRKHVPINAVTSAEAPSTAPRHQ